MQTINRRLLALALYVVAIAPTGPALASPQAKAPSRFKTERDKRRAEKRSRGLR